MANSKWMHTHLVAPWAFSIVPVLSTSLLIRAEKVALALLASDECDDRFVERRGARRVARARLRASPRADQARRDDFRSRRCHRHVVVQIPIRPARARRRPRAPRAQTSSRRAPRGPLRRRARREGGLPSRPRRDRGAPQAASRRRHGRGRVPRLLRHRRRRRRRRRMQGLRR